MRRTSTFLALVAILATMALVAALLTVSPAAGSAFQLLPAFTPEQAVRRQVQCPPPLRVAPGSFQIETVRQPAPGSVVVFYRAECSGPGAASLFQEGDSAVRLSWWGWQSTGASLAESPLPPPVVGGAPSYMLHSISHHTVDLGPPALAQVHGRIDAPDGTTVEVILSDGTVVQDQTRNGTFVFRVGEALGLCTLRALDAAGQLQADIPLAIGLGINPAGPPPCGP